ncbi:uncharacterized protein LY89DRAFT_712866 [Mollisia scopiformis]|uniref:VOC domain-containing protein n=1 Tax=Mollisia scopiformis TaxID=149040 RepID=A0A194XUT6_MOLSC|nr:uncharacterized protein LY89DRAFT_712866 [Mollisia scopiformis]KUJ23901.1 hypothetical protein LY89DRAFT_712866 [Mollisia scopiformis]
MPCDHYSLQVPESKFEDVVAFLLTSLKHIGFKEFYRPIPTCVGLGDGRPYLWIQAVPEGDGLGEALEILLSKHHTHMAFTAETHEQVQEFHTAALKAGGKDNGAPGLRPQFGPNYYAAFVKDPACGINFEVICRAEAS